MKTDNNKLETAREALKSLCENPEKSTKINILIALKDEILAARKKGISFRNIEKTLLNAGILVSTSTIVRSLGTKTKKTSNFTRKPNKYQEI